MKNPEEALSMIAFAKRNLFDATYDLNNSIFNELKQLNENSIYERLLYPQRFTPISEILPFIDNMSNRINCELIISLQKLYDMDIRTFGGSDHLREILQDLLNIIHDPRIEALINVPVIKSDTSFRDAEVQEYICCFLELKKVNIIIDELKNMFSEIEELLAAVEKEIHNRDKKIGPYPLDFTII